MENRENNITNNDSDASHASSNAEMQQQPVSEKERAQKNNEQNLRNAADIAMATKNPYAMAVGGAVKLADKVTGGKSTEMASKSLTKAINRAPGGKLIQNKLNKTNESGLGDKAGQAASMMGPNKTSKLGGINSSNASGIAKNNSRGKTPNSLTKNKGKSSSFINKNNLKKSKNETTGENNGGTESDDQNEGISEESSSTTLTPKNLKIKLLMAKVVLVLAGAFLVLVMTLVILSPILTVISSVASFFSSDKHKSDDTSYVNNSVNQELLDAEIRFNDALVGNKSGSRKGIIAEFEDEYGITIDKYLLQATLMYRFFGNNSIIDSNTEDISDEDFEKAAENLENSDEESNTNTNNSISSSDYDIAIKNMRTIAKMMIFEEGGEYLTDSTVGGTFYNKLIDSSFLTSYYKGMLIDEEYETRKKLVDGIFEYAELARTMVEGEDLYTFLSDTSIIYMQVCKNMGSGYYKTKNINGIKVFDNPLINEGTQYPLYFTFTDWLKGIMEGEVGSYIHEDYREGLKAMMVAASSFLLGDKRSGFDLKNGVMYYPTGNCRQVSCDPVNGCSYVTLDNKHGTAYSGYKRYSSGNHKPLTESESKFLDSVIAEVFGEVMVKKGVTTSTFIGSSDIINGNYYSDKTYSSCSNNCLGQKEAMIDAKNGLSYREILDKYYNNFDILNVKEGLYYDNSTSTGYTGSIQLNEEFHYHQSDQPWGSQNLCDSGPISSNGCNVTSAAITISLLKNQKITPKMLNDTQSKNKFCSTSSRAQMIDEYIKMNGLKTTKINVSGGKNNASVQDMISKIATGNYVAVVRIKPNQNGRYNTKGGHYVTIVGVKMENGKQKVLVWDPGSKSKSRDNYWADLNDDILPIVQPDYSFILAGR